MGRRTRWLGLALGCLLVALGVAETVRVVRSGDGGLAFWFGTLVGGGALVLAGTLLADTRARLSVVLTTVGCVVGALPTMWTVVVPVLLATLVVLRLRAVASPQPVV
ncbi:MAG TPA: hypothetical protein VFI44_03475 [Ornithinibacter sp.]|nr:hypothetical protein [Ornithinibacter sp.]